MLCNCAKWSYLRFLAALAAACLANGTLAAAAADAVSQVRWRFGNAGSGLATPGSGRNADRGSGCGTDTLSQSNDPDTIGNDSVWCGNLTANAETSLAREFVAPNDLLLECVQFGVQTNSGATWPVQVRVLQGAIGTPYAQLVELGSTTVPIPAGTGSQFFSANFSGLAITAGTTFVVELKTPSRLPADGGDNALLSLGCNGAGETAPSYLRAPACGVAEFLTFSAVGFGNLSIVMSLGVETDNCGVCAPPDPNDLIENEVNCTNNLNGGCDFSTTSPPFMRLGGGNCGVCGTLWEDEAAMDRDWYDFDVPGSGFSPVTLTLYGTTSSGILCEVYSGNGTCGGLTLVPGGRFDHQCDLPPTTHTLTLAAPARYYVRILPGTVGSGPTLSRPGYTCPTPYVDSYHLSVSGIVGCGEPGTLLYAKFRDDDCDGAFDSGEPLLSGWAFVITNEDTGEQINVLTTGSSDSINVPLGNYTVTEIPQPGFRVPCEAVRVTITDPNVWGEAVLGNCPCPAQDFSLDVWCGVGWQVVSTPPGVGGLAALPRPVNQVTPHSAWDPNVCWMSATPNGNVGLPVGTYVYEWCFCLDERFSNPLLDLCVKADDSSTVYLNGVLIGNGIAFNQPGCGAVTTADPTLFRPGQNCIQIVVNNAGGPTGVSVSGIMLADDGRCCFQECPCVPPPANMTGWWMLDEIGGPTAFDSAGVLNNGTHTNGPAFAVGRVNAARFYDGVNDYTAAPDHPELNVGFGPFTVDAWIRTIDGTGVIASKFSAQTTPLDRRGYQLSLNGGNLMLSIWSGPLSGGNYTFVGPSLADGRWHHVAASVVQNNTNGAKLYVDGVPQTFPIVGVVGNLNTTVPFRIGAPSTAAFGPALFTGDIDEVELFKRALSPAEIWGIWRAGSNGKCRPVFDIGDMNCDGFITVGDISGFVLALTDPTQYDVQYPDCDIDLADVNGDGFVSVGDISAFVTLLTGG